MRMLQKLLPYDRLIIGYLLVVMVFLAISHQPSSAALRITLVHGAAILFVLLIANFSTRSPLAQIVHDFYPAMLFMILFSEFTHTSTALFTYWLEPLLIKFDIWAFGGSPQQWAAARLSPEILEFLAFSYWSYYLIIPGTLFFVYRKNYPYGLIDATTRMCLTMFACYLLFMLSPARGPHHALPVNGAALMDGGFFTNMVLNIQKVGSVQGAAFPSSHVAVAWAMFFVLLQHAPKIAWPLALLIAALTFSVVTMGYHFSLDALGGVVVALGINAAWPRDNARTNSVRARSLSRHSGSVS
jgi:membrane-associated phospholipid phosphatase